MLWKIGSYFFKNCGEAVYMYYSVSYAVIWRKVDPQKKKIIYIYMKEMNSGLLYFIKSITTFCIIKGKFLVTITYVFYRVKQHLPILLGKFSNKHKVGCM